MYYWTQSFGLNTTHKADFHLTAPHSLPYSPTPKNQGAAICLLPTNPCLLPSCPLFLSPLVPKPLLCNKHHWLRMELSPDNVTWNLKAGLYHQNGWMSHNLIITEKHQSSDLTWYHIFFHLWSGRDSCLYSSGYVGEGKSRVWYNLVFLGVSHSVHSTIHAFVETLSSSLFHPSYTTSKHSEAGASWNAKSPLKTVWKIDHHAGFGCTAKWCPNCNYTQEERNESRF